MEDTIYITDHETGKFKKIMAKLPIPDGWHEEDSICSDYKGIENVAREFLFGDPDTAYAMYCQHHKAVWVIKRDFAKHIVDLITTRAQQTAEEFNR